MADKMVISVRELAEQFDISLPTAYALTQREGFPVVLIGKKKRIPVAALERWLAEEAEHGRAV